MGFSGLRMNPARWAIAFALGASGFAILASLLEGTLLAERVLRYGDATFLQRPYRDNISTILDFAIFDPLAIYFMLEAGRGFRKSYARFRKDLEQPLFHRRALVLVSMVVGISAMWFYFNGYIGSTIFTESFAVGPEGRAKVSFTGWTIFAATSTFLSLTTYMAIEYGRYVLFVRTLRAEDLGFNLPPNPSENVSIAIKPCMHAANFLLVIFVIIAIFVIRDFLQLGLHESRRVWLLIPYILACLTTFLPFWHLHRLMQEQKERIIEANNAVIEKELRRKPDAGTDSVERFYAIDPRKLIAAVDRIEKLQDFYKSINVWPASASALLLPNMSIVISIVTLGMKFVDSVKGP